MIKKILIGRYRPRREPVWGGFYVMMAGALIALVKRSREARRAAVEKTLPLPRPQPADSVGAPPRAPLPLHTRSRL